MQKSTDLDEPKRLWIGDDLKDELKIGTDMVALLEYLGATGIKPGNKPGQYKADCLFPDCDATGHDYFNNDKKNFNCFECGRGGDVLKLIMLVKKCSFYQAKHFLMEWNRGTIREKITSQLPLSPEPTDQDRKHRSLNLPYQPFRRELGGLRIADLPLLAEKGISAETAEKFGIGYYAGTGIMKGRFVVPIYDSKQPGTDKENLLAYTGCSVTRKQKEIGDWKFPDGFEKGHYLFNLNRLLDQTKEIHETISRHGVIVVESFWSVFKLWQAGIKNVVALMGTALTREQEQLLLEITKKTTLWLDQNKCGLAGLEKILRHPQDGGINGLLNKTHVRIIDPRVSLFREVGDRVKPYQFSEEEIKRILS